LLYDFCGSPGFFAPEIVIDKEQGYKGMNVDVWGVGCILLELRIGHDLFNKEWMRVYDYKGYSRPTKFRRRIQEGLNSVLRLLVEKNDSGLPPKGAATEPERVNATGSEVQGQEVTVDVDLLSQMLELDPGSRISAADAMRHRWFGTSKPMPRTSQLVKMHSSVNGKSNSSDYSGMSTPSTETERTLALQRASGESASNLEPPFKLGTSSHGSAASTRVTLGDAEDGVDATGGGHTGGGHTGGGDTDGGQQRASSSKEEDLPPLSPRVAQRSPNMVLRPVGNLVVDCSVQSSMTREPEEMASPDDSLESLRSPHSGGRVGKGDGGRDNENGTVNYVEITMSKRERERFTVNHMPPVEPDTPNMRSARKGLRAIEASPMTSSGRAKRGHAHELAGADGQFGPTSLVRDGERGDPLSPASLGLSTVVNGGAELVKSASSSPPSLSVPQAAERKRSVGDPSCFPGSAIATKSILEELSVAGAVMPSLA